MNSITTHVLDTARGTPAAGVSVTLHVHSAGGWQEAGRGITNQDGRVSNLLAGKNLKAGRYRLTFDTAAYLVRFNVSSFFPEVAILFEVQDANQHYHVPLLLSPFGYSTYRGT
jgi:5-hydroxyisourate hydrolase